MSCDGNQQDCSSSRSNYWLNLPRDITVMILQKVGILEIFMSVQLVCTEWREIICTDPSIWTTIRVVNWLSYWNRRLNLYPDEYDTHIENMIKLAVDRSCGTLFDLDLNEEYFMSEELLKYVVERCTQIRHLRGLPLQYGVLERVAPSLPLLEDLQVVGRYNVLSLEAIETLVRCCPRLRSLKFLVQDVNAVEALLDGCPHLESLHLHIQHRDNYKTKATVQMMKKLSLTLDDPCTWSTIRVNRMPGILRTDGNVDDSDDVKNIIRLAVDKSYGGLVDVDLGIFINSADILSYVVERCTRIRRLCGWVVTFDCAEKALCTTAPRLSLLENLEVTCSFFSTFSEEIIQTLGRYCPRITSLAIPIGTDELAKTLAKSFPQLRHLGPGLGYKLTDEGVEALLDGCPHLESLNLADCSQVRLYDTLDIRCAQQIKHLQRPDPLRYYDSDSSFEKTREEVEEEE